VKLDSELTSEWLSTMGIGNSWLSAAVHCLCGWVRRQAGGWNTMKTSKQGSLGRGFSGTGSSAQAVQAACSSYVVSRSLSGLWTAKTGAMPSWRGYCGNHAGDWSKWGN